MSGVTPDHAGFRDAQRRLRQAFGEPVRFLAPAVDEYPPGTRLDPDTGTPYDPTIEPIRSQPSTVVSCTVAQRTAIEGAVDFSALGAVEQGHVLLIADIDDRAVCEPCAECIVRDERHRIEAQKPDGIGGVQRWLVFARRA